MPTNYQELYYSLLFKNLTDEEAKQRLIILEEEDDDDILHQSNMERISMAKSNNMFGQVGGACSYNNDDDGYNGVDIDGNNNNNNILNDKYISPSAKLFLNINPDLLCIITSDPEEVETIKENTSILVLLPETQEMHASTFLVHKNTTFHDAFLKHLEDNFDIVFKNGIKGLNTYLKHYGKNTTNDD